MFSLTNHAQNRFYNPLKWVPRRHRLCDRCAYGALRDGHRASYLRLCGAVLGVQAFAGLIWFGRHASAVARQPAASWFEKILNGAPPMAPLLLPNLALLAGIGSCVLYSMIAGQTVRREPRAEVSGWSGAGDER